MDANFQKQLDKLHELRHQLATTKDGLNATCVDVLFREAQSGLQFAKMAIDSKNRNDNEALLRQRSSAHDALQVIHRFLPTVDLKDEARIQLEAVLDELRFYLARV